MNEQSSSGIQVDMDMGVDKHIPAQENQFPHGLVNMVWLCQHLASNSYKNPAPDVLYSSRGGSWTPWERSLNTCRPNPLSTHWDTLLLGAVHALCDTTTWCTMSHAGCTTLS